MICCHMSSNSSNLARVYVSNDAPMKRTSSCSHPNVTRAPHRLAEREVNNSFTWEKGVFPKGGMCIY